MKNTISEIRISYTSGNKEKAIIKSSDDSYKLFYATWSKHTLELQEEFKVLLLNRSNKVLGIYPMSKGGVSGTIVDSTTDPLAPTSIDVSWGLLSGIVIPMASNIGVRTLFISNIGNVGQVEGNMTEGQRRDNIRLGIVYYAGGEIQEVRDNPNIRHQDADTFSDYISFLPPVHRTKGMLIDKVSNQLSFYRHVGEYFSAGINWDVDRKNPNVVIVPELGDDTTPVLFATMDRNLDILATSVSTIPFQLML